MQIYNPKSILVPVIATLPLILMLNGCTVKQPVFPPRYPDKPPASSQTEPVKTPPQTSSPQPQTPDSVIKPAPPQMGAGASLYTSAQEAMSRGNYSQAEMMLERALKIEPRNAHYWYSMAEAKYNQGQYSQTVHLCSKSKSLAGRNPQLLQLNTTLSNKAKQRL